MASRIDLHYMLVDLLGSSNVYFQSPEGMRMEYPAIRYSRTKIDSKFAEDEVYMKHNVYQLTVIDEDPDSDIVERVSNLPRCRHNNHYVKDGLNHDVFTITY